MRVFFMMLFTGLAYIVRCGCGVALIGLFFGGFYVLIVESIGVGLMMIGVCVVGAWRIQIVSSFLFATGAGIAAVGNKDE